MDKRKAYEEKLAAELAGWNAQLDGFKAKADKATAQAKIEYCKITESLQRKHDEGKTKLHALKSSTDEAWEVLKTGSENAWSEMKIAFQGAVSKFN